jgi:hypothetical protein
LALSCIVFYSYYPSVFFAWNLFFCNLMFQM